MCLLHGLVRRVLFYFLVIIAFPVCAASTDLDPGFAGDGLLYDAIDDGAVERVVTVASLANPDGSVVLLGRASPKGSDGITTYSRVVLRKIQADGGVDTSFGEAGQASRSAGSTSSVASLVKSSAYPFGFLRQADGKYVVYGYADQLGTSGLQRDAFVMRFSANGSIDATFGQHGVVIYQFSNSQTDYASAVSELPDGRLLVGGIKSGSQGYVMRLHSDGSTDTSFGTDGMVNYGSLSSGMVTVYEPVVSAIIPLSSGQFLVGGTDNLTGDPHRMRVSRFNANGSLDTGFGVNGTFADAPMTYASSYGRSMLVDNQGRIVVLGYRDVDTSIEKDFDLFVVRLTADGILDTAFDGDGKLVMPLGAGNDYMLQVRADTADRLVVIGNNNHDGINNLNAETRLARFLPDGSLDTTFDTDGVLQTSAVTHGLAMLAQDAGKWLIAGSYYDAGGTGDYAMAMRRLTESGAVDTAFGVAGLLRLDSRVHYAQTQIVLQQPDGKWLVGGLYCQTMDNRGDCGKGYFTVVRYLENGSRDETFGVGGVALVGGSLRGLESGILQADGKIVVERNVPKSFSLSRLDATGQPDTTFSDDGTLELPVGFSTSSILTAPRVFQQSDSKLVVAGQVCLAVDGSMRCTAYGINVVRWLSDGELDPAFDGDGVAVIAGNATVYALTQRADASLLLFTSAGIRVVNDNGSDAGLWSGEAARRFSRMPDGRWLVLVGNTVKRLDANGNVDASFGTVGSVTFDPTAETDTAVEIVPMAGGRFLVAGYSCIERVTGWCVKNVFALTAHAKNGEVDTGYLPGGVFTAAIGETDKYLSAAALQPDGKLVSAFGRITNATLHVPHQEAHFLLARWDHDDADGDGVVDSLDAFPSDPLRSVDTDIDGITDAEDVDDDGDGVPDYLDRAPLDLYVTQEIQWPLESQYRGSEIVEQLQAN